jgi:hypothetical protein
MRIYPEELVDTEFEALGNLGYTGSLNDRQFAFLRDRNLTGALADMFSNWDGSLYPYIILSSNDELDADYFELLSGDSSPGNLSISEV